MSEPGLSESDLSEFRAAGNDNWVPPVQFARDILGVSLWWKQEDVLDAVMRERRVAVKSGNGLGKDFTAAVAVLWYLHCHDPGIVLSTAPTFRQVRHVLWRQIHRLHRGAADTLGGTLLDTRWELAEDRYALGLSADGADQFQGFHCPNVLVVVDEAEGVHEEIYEAIDSVMTSQYPKLLLIGNPTSTSGPFHRAFHQERGIYETITISALDSPNVKQGRIDIAGLTTAEWVAERRKVWGENSDLFRSRVLGQFPLRGEDNLISMDDINAAIDEERDRSGLGTGRGDACLAPADPADATSEMDKDDPLGLFLPGMAPSSHGRVVVGVDVARFGSDRTVVLMRRGDRVESIKAFSRIDTMTTAGEVMVAVREHRPDAVNIDVIGVGGGVADRLREQGIRARGINVAEGPRRDRTCANLRAEGYKSLAQRFRDRRIRIPRDTELISELADLRYSYDSRGRLLMESKERLRGRGATSPDRADALMLAFLDDYADEFYPDQPDTHDRYARDRYAHDRYAHEQWRL